MYCAKKQKHTTGGIPRWSPTLVLVARFSAYVWQSGRDAQFSLTYGRMCKHIISALSCTLLNSYDLAFGRCNLVVEGTGVAVTIATSLVFLVDFAEK